MPMSDENRRRASERMKQMQADKKVKSVVVADPEPEPKPVMKIYWSKSAKHTLAIPDSEKRSGGRIIQMEQTIQFWDNRFMTDDPAKQTIIESSEPYSLGYIQELKDQQPATGVKVVGMVASGG